jgi:hypothetical protein
MLATGSNVVDEQQARVIQRDPTFDQPRQGPSRASNG